MGEVLDRRERGCTGRLLERLPLAGALPVMAPGDGGGRGTGISMIAGFSVGAEAKLQAPLLALAAAAAARAEGEQPAAQRAAKPAQCASTPLRVL